MILAIAKNHGGTDEYRKFVGIPASICICFHVPDGAKEIPEEQIWRVFRFVHERNNPNVEVILELSARNSDSGVPIYCFEDEFDIERILNSLQACQARIHVVFS